MKEKKQYVPYENFGLGMTINMVLSYIKSYGSTYASSQHIADLTDTSRKSITRSIKYLNDNGLITIDNPNSRSRVLRIVEGYRDILSSQKDKVTHTRDTVTLMKDTVTHKRDTTTHYTTVNTTVDNKAHTTVDTKGELTTDEMRRVESLINNKTDLLTSMISEVNNETITENETV